MKSLFRLLIGGTAPMSSAEALCRYCKKTPLGVSQHKPFPICEVCFKWAWKHHTPKFICVQNECLKRHMAVDDIHRRCEHVPSYPWPGNLYGKVMEDFPAEAKAWARNMGNMPKRTDIAEAQIERTRESVALSQRATQLAKAGRHEEAAALMSQLRAQGQSAMDHAQLTEVFAAIDALEREDA